MGLFQSLVSLKMTEILPAPGCQPPLAATESTKLIALNPAFYFYLFIYLSPPPGVAWEG